jgi:exopolysaccharide biosynthesis polyprenyl glycosylphosphotransferase
VIKKWSRPTIYLVGIIDDDPKKLGALIEGFKVVGGSDQLHEIIDHECVTDLIVSISGKMQGSMFQALLEAQEAGLEVIRMQKFYEEVMGRTPIQYLEADWILRSFVDHLTVSSFYDLAKRLIDITVALVGALILLATFPFIGLAIVLDSGFPILYAQDRLGKGGQPYRIIKFRTMYQNAESNGPQFTREHDSRITRVGKFLRKSHMDEFPQFINVLRGEMSMVGPRSERPELVKELQKQVPFYRARLLVKPGITGWAQVNFGYADSVEDTAIKIEYDLYYITHRSIVLDLSIMMRTFGTIFGFRGQ